LEAGDSAKCPNCGKRARQLFKLTAEDIQRVYSPEQVGIYWGVCGDCREEFRSAARLQVRYRTRQVIRDASLMIPSSFGVLFLLTRMFPRAIFLIDALAFFTGMAYVYHEFEGRYAFTHNFVWSLKSRTVMLGFSLAAASVFVSMVYL
jgi:hypothetical protein